jgi:hypothetical protein
MFKGIKQLKHFKVNHYITKSIHKDFKNRPAVCNVQVWPISFSNEAGVLYCITVRSWLLELALHRTSLGRDEIERVFETIYTSFNFMRTLLCNLKNIVYCEFNKMTSVEIPPSQSINFEMN